MNFESQILNVPVEEIVPNRFQPRINFEDESLKELADSIRQHGLIQPIVLRKIGDKYEIIAGERRYRASKMAGLTNVPAVIANIDDKKSAEVAIVENVQRKTLSGVEEAKSYKALLDQGFMTVEMLAQKLSIPTEALSKKLRLLELTPEVQDAIMQNQISERHGRSLLNVSNREKQIELLNKTINERLTVKGLDDLIASMNLGKEENNMNDNLFASPLNLGETISENRMNDLEVESANMSMTENQSIFNSSPNVALSPAVPTIEKPSMPVDNIESLDLLDVTPVPTSPNIIDAENKINALISELQMQGYNITLNKNDLVDKISINIEIKK